ncbi:hypothetical protein [Kribbella turkmenica]|uniref:hypothetical protein n=1 Tax=Kribbella turkmenica TaxID=2530375 RepID=UPI00192D54CE|nr:hypothetical protein [Kribbella turkmenica]
MFREAVGLGVGDSVGETADGGELDGGELVEADGEFVRAVAEGAALGVTLPGASPAGPATSAHPTSPAATSTAPTVNRPTFRR